MPKLITIGRRLIPSEQIAFVEPFDAKANADFQTERNFLGRIVMLNRDSYLMEETPDAFAKANGFRMLVDDKVATNPDVHFRVETYVPAENFTPSRAYASRILWRDLDGNEQSKLLLSLPETALAVAVRGETETPVAASIASQVKPARQRRQPRSLEVQ